MVDKSHEMNGKFEHPEVRFEPSDASFGGIVAIMAGTIVVVALIQVCVLAFLNNFSYDLDRDRRSAYPLAPNPSTALPPEPRLEQIDRLLPAAANRPGYRYQEGDFPKKRAMARLRVLNSYGPAETQGFVHIPIERAMQLLAEKKMLKARAAHPGVGKHSAGLVDAGEPNSGRVFRGGRP